MLYTCLFQARLFKNGILHSTFYRPLNQVLLEKSLFCLTYFLNPDCDPNVRKVFTSDYISVQILMSTILNTKQKRLLFRSCHLAVTQDCAHQHQFFSETFSGNSFTMSEIKTDLFFWVIPQRCEESLLILINTD